MLEIRIKAMCYPTENRDKVISSIKALFPDADVTGEDIIQGRSSSLDKFAEQLRKQRIRDAARAVLRRGLKERSTSFRINKQVAAVGKVSFAEETHPLGDIEVSIESDEIVSVIDGIAPDTRSEVA